MKYVILAGAASLAMAVPATLSAQQQPTTGQQPMGQQPGATTTDQRSAIDSLPADRRQSYDAMSAEMQAYYRGLTAEQQDAWWLLNEEQRGQIFALQPTQRDAAWASILDQVNAARAQQTGPGTATGTPQPGATPPTADEPMAGTATPGPVAGGMVADTGTLGAAPAGTTAGNIRFVSSERVQAVAADTAPATGEVPICRAGQEDNCINQFEATGRGNRPLDRFPENRGTTAPRR